MRNILSAAVALLVAVACPAFADTIATQSANLARFEKYAGTPVEQFNMWELYKWQGLGPDTLAVWSKVNEVWLLTIAQPCNRLEDAKAVTVTTKMSRQVNRRLDYVIFASQHCQIIKIRPLDYKSMLKDGEGGASATK